MANTIALSSDMNTVYIIGSSNTVIFSQSLSGDGAFIILDSNGKLSGQTPNFSSPGTIISKSVDGWQWAAAYNETTEKLYFIGVDDTDINFTDAVDFQIDQRNGVQIKRSGTNLELIARLV